MTMALHEYTQRPKRAAEADGLNDILSGVTFLAITLMEYTNQRLIATFHGPDFAGTPDFKRELAFFLLAVLGMFAIILFSKRYVKTLREKFVYARLGYFAPQTSFLLRRKLLMLAAGMGSAVLIAVGTKSLLEAGKPVPFFNSGMLVAMLGIITSVTYFIQFAKLGFTRHLLLGGIAIAAAICLSAARFSDLPALGCFVVILAISLIVAGSVTFTQLLRQPVITASEDDAE